MRLRNKKIGKNFQISCAQYRKNTAMIYVHEYNKYQKRYIKYQIGEYPISQALYIYNSTKTVRQIKTLLGK